MVGGNRPAIMVACLLPSLFWVKKVKPLLGLSRVGGVFNEEVLKAMRESVSTKPAIFAMSNPTMNAECTAIDAFNYAGENVVFASGSPFENVVLGNGKVVYDRVQWRRLIHVADPT